VESLERFAQNQLVIEEYVSQWLAPTPSDFGRLADVATLRDVTSGHYHHPALEEVYSEASVHQALMYCHEELFEKVISMPLDMQEWDLRTHFARMNAPVADIAFRWLEVEHFLPSCPLASRHICAICSWRILVPSSAVWFANKPQWLPRRREERLRFSATRLAICPESPRNLLL
jgi:hypothetical protein